MSRATDGHREGNGRAPLEPGRFPGRGTGTPVSHVLAPDSFARLVLVERRRSERSGRPFGLLVLRASASLDSGASLLGSTVLDALGSATRGADVTGWIAPPSTLGVLLTDLSKTRPWAAVEGIRARIERALERSLPNGSAVTLAGQLFPERVPPEGETGALEPSRQLAVDAKRLVEPLLYPELGKARGTHRRTKALKRVLDIVGSAAFLVPLAPLVLLIAGLIRLTSPGPTLFRQVRVGYRGRPFTMLKFRTMAVNADETVHREFVTRFITDGQHATPPNGAGLFKLVGDSRVTPIGRLLRRSSLDELPQLWNVLRGEMSLVGPRPPLPYEFQAYAPWHRRRIFEARPGLTGLWQVRGRSRTKFDEIVRLDLRYARTQSLSTDLRILLATPRAVISGKGAH